MKGTLTKTPNGWAVKTPTETLMLHKHDHPEMDTARYEGKEVEFTRKLGDWNDSPINEPHWTALLTNFSDRILVKQPLITDEGDNFYLLHGQGKFKSDKTTYSKAELFLLYLELHKLITSY